MGLLPCQKYGTNALLTSLVSSLMFHIQLWRMVLSMYQTVRRSMIEYVNASLRVMDFKPKNPIRKENSMFSKPVVLAWSFVKMVCERLDPTKNGCNLGSGQGRNRAADA